MCQVVQVAQRHLLRRFVHSTAQRQVHMVSEQAAPREQVLFLPAGADDHPLDSGQNFFADFGMPPFTHQHHLQVVQILTVRAPSRF